MFSYAFFDHLGGIIEHNLEKKFIEVCIKFTDKNSNLVIGYRNADSGQTIYEVHTYRIANTEEKQIVPMFSVTSDYKSYDNLCFIKVEKLLHVLIYTTPDRAEAGFNPADVVKVFHIDLDAIQPEDRIFVIMIRDQDLGAKLH